MNTQTIPMASGGFFSVWIIVYDMFGLDSFYHPQLYNWSMTIALEICGLNKEIYVD